MQCLCAANPGSALPARASSDAHVLVFAIAALMGATMLAAPPTRGSGRKGTSYSAKPGGRWSHTIERGDRRAADHEPP